MTDWTEAGRVRWRRLGPFGVEIDADLAQPFSTEESDLFLALYRAHGLIIAHGQNLTRTDQVRLLSLIGPILERQGESGFISTDAGGASLSELRFHADGAYAPRPLDALSLHAIDVVDGASSTRFVSAESVWANLPDMLRSRIEGRSARMISPAFEILGQRSCDVRDPPFMQSAIKPLLYSHLHNESACLWVSEMHAAGIEGMTWEEGRDLLHELFDLLYAPTNLLEHRWHRGDIIIWDNVRYQHARGALSEVGRRVLQRVIVGTEGAAPHILMA